MQREEGKYRAKKEKEVERGRKGDLVFLLSHSTLVDAASKLGFMSVENSEESLNEAAQPSLWMGLVSLAIIIHFFFVFAVLFSANDPISSTQARMTRRLRPYTQLLQLNPAGDLGGPMDQGDQRGGPQYSLTDGLELDVDHRIEILEEGKDEQVVADWELVSSTFSHVSERYKRYQRLARAIHYLTAAGDNDTAALLIRGIAKSELDAGRRPRLIRCRKHVLQTREELARGINEDPWDEIFFEEVYRAATVIDSHDNVEINKLDPAGQVARPTAKAGE
ncbi:MAG: hypothetical protein ACI9G1_000706 [Pirellulaceae bacterium]|jgi:hypothetical protein